MLEEQLFAVTDLAYQAALDPDLWPDVLEGLADALGGSVGALIWRSLPGRRDGGVSVRADPDALDRYFQHYHVINPIQLGYEKLAPVRVGGSLVVTDAHCIERSALERTETFNDFLRVFDIENMLLIGGDSVGRRGGSAFNLFRTRREGPFDETQFRMASAIHRSLNRSFELGRRLGAERRLSETLADYVGGLAGAVFIVGRDARVVFANPAGEALLAARDGLSVRSGALRAATSDAQRQLGLLLGEATALEDTARRDGALALPRPSGRRPLALTATPARSEGGPANEPLALLAVVEPDAEPPTREAQLRALFGFTAAEARIAAALVAGHDQAEIAERLGLSIHTVRLQVARIRDKTGTRRQGEFIALVLRTLGPASLAD